MSPLASTAVPSDDSILSLAVEARWGTTAPVHLQIGEWICGLVVSGELVPGEKLPPERQLAEALSVSRMTLRQALEGLQTAGWITRTLGRSGGAVITEHRSNMDIASLAGLRAQLLQSAMSASSRLISATQHGPDADTRTALRLGTADEVFEIQRVRLADMVPVVFERSFFPVALFPGLLEHELTGSMYSIMRSEFALGPVSAAQEINAVIADAAVADLLEIAVGSPLLGIVRTSLSGNGTPVEFSRDLICSERLHVTVSGRIVSGVEPPEGSRAPESDQPTGYESNR
ncbi:GntR family transcriptional regulator [Cryobacterium sp. MLB-32]|uniref:GntR family transcriptional regulator n=1 Tax=Cryobacterium sp. MLB-32 TaxID=1529318 RepID=UPI00068B7D2D|nr:GntR family transcriptional regulator [Cryobacterium sp. MLB-32]